MVSLCVTSWSFQERLQFPCSIGWNYLMLFGYMVPTVKTALLSPSCSGCGSVVLRLQMRTIQ